MKPEHYYDPYDRLAPFYDWMARGLLLPFGGETRFRRRAAGALDVGSDMRVVELGCGTGGMTRQLVRLGARVTAIDSSAPMLRRARRRAPQAQLVEADILAFEGEHGYDRALLAFVLHEMTAPIRRRALDVARRALRPGGLLGVLDFAGEAPAPLDRALRTYLKIAEPEMATELLDGALTAELEGAGFAVVRRRLLARGTAQMLVARTPR